MNAWTIALPAASGDDNQFCTVMIFVSFVDPGLVPNGGAVLTAFCLPLVLKFFFD